MVGGFLVCCYGPDCLSSFASGVGMAIRAEFLEHGGLTDRECEVARLMAEGYSDKDISGLLAISIHTVNAHTQMIYEKLQLRSQRLNTRVSAILTMIARGMIRVSLYGLVGVLVLGSVQWDSMAIGRVNGRVQVRVRKDADC